MTNIINLKQTRKNLEQSLDYINEGLPLGEQVRFQHLHTLSKIIYVQSLRLAHYAGIGTLYSNELKAEQIACNKPKCYLAKACQVTSKTIQNHIKRLEEKGLIKRVNQDGRLLLIVHPLLLSITPKHEQIRRVLWEKFKNINSQINRSLENNRGKTFPTNNHSGNLNSQITSDVEMLKSPSHDVTSPDFQETQKAKHPVKKNKKETHPAVETQEIRKQEAGGRGAAEQEFVEKQVQTIWRWCVENLYDDRDYLADSQQEYAIDFLTKTFDHKYGAAVYKHISHLRTRLYKWKKFVDKPSQIKRFTPLPNSFFNPDNIHGFAKTDLWIKEAERKEHHNQIWKHARQIERTALQILVGQYPHKRKNPINQQMETHYRPLSINERLTELHKLEHRVNRVSEQFPNINNWYRNRLQQLIELTNGQIAI